MEDAQGITPISETGVRIPRSVKFLDCRTYDIFGEQWIRDGRKYLPAEAMLLGIGLRPYADVVYPAGCIPYRDLRSAEPKYLAEELRDMRKMLADEWRKFRRVKRMKQRDRGKGGLVAYRPKAITFENFGYSIVADRRDGVTRYWRK